jgi:hypothetical protein
MASVKNATIQVRLFLKNKELIHIYNEEQKTKQGLIDSLFIGKRCFNCKRYLPSNGKGR